MDFKENILSVLMKRLAGVVLLSCTMTISLWAQQYSMRHFTAVDGLPRSRVNMLLEDGDGYLWIATHGGGLARFDGREFKVYTTRDGLSSNVVQYLKLDAKQNLWIVNPVGITRFNGFDFKKFIPQGIHERLSVRRVFEINDTIFFVNSQRALGKIFRDSVYYWNKPVKKDKFILYTHLMPGKEVCLYLSDSSFLIKSPHGDYSLSHAGDFNYALSLFNYGSQMWVHTERGYYAMDVQGRKFVKGELPVKNFIIQYDSMHNVFWTRHDNSLLMERHAGTLQQVDTLLSGVAVTQILPDSEGNTWVSTSGSGLYKYYVKDFDRLSSPLLGRVLALAKGTDGALWIGTQQKGIWRLKNGKWQTYASPAVSEINGIKMSAQGEIWVASYGGLGRYDEQRDRFQWYNREAGLVSTYINAVDVDEEGKVWYGTRSNGAGYYDGKVFKNYSLEDGLLNREVMALKYLARQHMVYVGSALGLSVIKANQVTKRIPLPELQGVMMNTIGVFKNWLALGSEGSGILFLDTLTLRRKLLTVEHGLPSDFINFLSEDEAGYIWVGTEEGISKLKVNDSLEITQNIHYGYENGLDGVETNRNAFLLADQKYFGLVDGVYHYNNLPREGGTSFGLHLLDVEIFYGQYPIRDFTDSLYGFFRLPYHPQMPADMNHITFYFNRVDKRYPRSVKFKYYLENFDKTWSAYSALGSATYSNIPPGNYTFKLLATQNDGSWQQTPLAYSFTILAPFYATWKFQLSVILSLAGLLILFFYLKVRKEINKIIEVERIRHQEQENLRKEIARDFHDEMGNQLTRIINYVSLMKLSKNGNATGLYDKIEHSAKYLYTGARDFIWSIDPENDELSKLFLHIRDFGEKLFEEKGITYRTLNKVNKLVKIPYGFSREANLIFKEAMTNVFNHSGASNVTFSMTQLEDLFEIKLTDDGQGFDINYSEKSNGLKNMFTRAERIGGKLYIDSQKGSGTIISLRLHINLHKKGNA